MNKALTTKNWTDGGNNYVLKGNSKNKWVGFQQTVLSDLIKIFNDNFNIVICGQTNRMNMITIVFPTKQLNISSLKSIRQPGNTPIDGQP